MGDDRSMLSPRNPRISAMPERGPPLIPSRSTLPGIQILRGIAAVLVVFHHALEESLGAASSWKSPDWLTTFGASGVDIFFVISGFIMIWVSFPRGGPAETPGRFLVKRICRIYPFYWACLAFLLLLASVGFYKNLDRSASTLLKSVLLLPNSHFLIGVAWTLVFEMYFYMLFTLTLFWRSAIVSAAVTTALIMTMMLIGGTISDPELRDYLANPLVLEFCFGMALALSMRRMSLPTRWSWTLCIAGFAGLLAAPVFVPHASTNGLPPFPRLFVWGLPALLIVASSLSPTLKRAGTLSRLGVLTGDASYAIYLTHPFVMITYAWLLKNVPFLSAVSQQPIIPLVIAVSVGLGFVAHLYAEKPLIALARTLLATPPSPARRPTG